jgi:hypothetical protein
LLDALLGKVNGVLTQSTCYAVKPLVCVDLCAGDGVQSDLFNASPRIMAKHCTHEFGVRNKATLHLIERDPTSFALLKNNMSCFQCVTMENTDARKYKLPPLSKLQAAFVHCDPNNFHQTPLTEDFVEGFSDCTMYLVTLGCNAEGIKRLPYDQRKGWFDYVSMLVERLPNHHDAILFWLIKDNAQWAYLCNVPKVWRDWAIETGVEKGGKLWPKGVGGVALRGSESSFIEQLDVLFLTERERDGKELLF